MDCEKLKNAVKKIEMSDEMKARVIKNCQLKTEENIMKRNKTNSLSKKPILAAAAALCLCFALAAAAGSRCGFFRDIKNWKGAVVGTQYEQASDEIEVTVISEGKELTVCASMLNPASAPYSELETLGIDGYQITDASGDVVVDGERTDFFEISDGEAKVKIPLDGISNGEYKLLITAFIGGKKADQPLRISGSWECAFSI